MGSTPVQQRLLPCRRVMARMVGGWNDTGKFSCSSGLLYFVEFRVIQKRQIFSQSLIMLLPLPVIPLLSYIPPKKFPSSSVQRIDPAVKDFALDIMLPWKSCRLILLQGFLEKVRKEPIGSPTKIFGRKFQLFFSRQTLNFFGEASILFQATVVIGLRGGCPPP